MIQRAKALWQDRAREYSILVDGKKAAAIPNGAEARMPIEPGEHSIVMQIDWCYSPELIVVASGEEDIHIECGANANPFLVLLYITLWKNRYIWLRRSEVPAI